MAIARPRAKGRNDTRKLKVLYLFPKEADEDVSKCIQDTFKKIRNVEFNRWDRLPKSDNIMHDLVDYIKTSDLVVLLLDTCDNEFNLNTMYELGLAQGFGRNVITIVSRANTRRLPFDILNRSHILHGNVLHAEDGQGFRDELLDSCLRCLGDAEIPEEYPREPKRPERPERDPALHLLKTQMNDVYKRLKNDKRLSGEIKAQIDQINVRARNVRQRTGEARDQIEEVRCGVTALLRHMRAVLYMRTSPLFCSYVLVCASLLALLPVLPLIPRLMSRSSSSLNGCSAAFFVVLLLGISMARARTSAMGRRRRSRIVVTALFVAAVSLVSTYVFEVVSTAQVPWPIDWSAMGRGTAIISAVTGSLLCFSRSNSLTCPAAFRWATLGGLITALLFFALRSMSHILLQHESPSKALWRSAEIGLLILVLSGAIIFLVRIPWMFTATFRHRPLPGDL